MRYKILLILLLFMPVVVNGQFVESSRRLGVDHLHTVGSLLGGGVSFIDYDNDGFEDVYLTGGTRPDRLFKNVNGEAFQDITAEAGLLIEPSPVTTAVTVADYNNDGHDDIFVSTMTDFPNLLFQNNGDGTFTELAAAAGIDGDRLWSMGASFADIDQDGDLDLYVINYLLQSRFINNEANEVVGFRHICFGNHFYQNNGNGSFTDITLNSGADNEGCALAVTFTDVNADGDQELYIANDFGAWVTPNALYDQDDSQARYLDIADSLGLDIGIYGMGIAAGDPNADGLFDYYITNIGPNALHIQQSNQQFIEQAVARNVDNTFSGNGQATSWGAVFFDYDNDMHQDLFVSNGFIGAANFLNTSVDDFNKLYKGDGALNFTDVSDVSLIDSEWVNRGVAKGDWDNDGRQDLVVATIYLEDGSTGFHTLFYHNRNTGVNNFLELKLMGTQSNRNAFGALIDVYAGGTRQRQELVTSGSHASSHSRVLHFGLGGNLTVDSLSIHWPSGTKQWYYDIDANARYFINESEQEVLYMGCADPEAKNFDPQAIYSTACIYPVQGCTDQQATNFNQSAEIDDGTCRYVTQLTRPSLPEWKVVNPVGAELYILGQGMSQKEYQLLISDMTGKIVLGPTRWQGEALPMTGRLARGTYLLEVSDQDKIVLREKLLVNGN